MSLEHDTISRKDIPAIYHRNVSISRIKDYPTGDFMAPCVDGKFIFNNTGEPVFITSSDGFVTKVESLSPEDREGLLRQVYFSLGAIEEYEGERNTPRGRRLISLEPIPIYVNKLRSTTNRFRNFSRFKSPDTHITVPNLTQKFDDIPTEEQHSYKEIQGKLLKNCSTIDSKNNLTAGLRHNVKSVWVMKTLFAEERIYGDDYPKTTKPSIYNHSARMARDSELFETNFVLNGTHSDYISGEELIAKRIPSMLWNEYSLKAISNSVQGMLVREYGFTISDTSDVRNKALGYTDSNADEYMAKTGLRILIPGRVGRTGIVYARIGKYVSRIKTTQDPTLSGKHALVYGYNQIGEEIIIGSCPIDELLQNGITLKLPDGEKWHLPFFESQVDALSYNDPDIQIKLDLKQDELDVLKKENEVLAKESKNLNKELDRKKEDNEKKWYGLFGLLTRNPAIATFISGLVITIITTVVKLVF